MAVQQQRQSSNKLIVDDDDDDKRNVKKRKTAAEDAQTNTDHSTINHGNATTLTTSKGAGQNSATFSSTSLSNNNNIGIAVDEAKQRLADAKRERDEAKLERDGAKIKVDAAELERADLKKKRDSKDALLNNAELDKVEEEIKRLSAIFVAANDWYRKRVEIVDSLENSLLAAKINLAAAVVVDANSPSAVVSYILAELRRHGITPKEEKQRGVYSDAERLAAWQLEQTRDRDETLKIALDYLRNGNARAGRDGYAATWAAPGSGKTHLLDSIVAEMRSHVDLRDRFVPIPITFNGNMDGQPRGVRGLLARMIYVHFVGMLAKEKFSKAFRVVIPIINALFPAPDESLDSNDVGRIVDTIVYDVRSTRPAASVVPVLLVDEIRLSASKESPDLVRLVYEAVTDQLPGRRVILTALDPASVRPSPYQSPSTSPTTTSTSSTSLIRNTPSFGVSGSNKPITWLPLPRLHTDDWEADKSDLLQAPLIAMAGGHPRTIAFVRQVRKQYPGDVNATQLLTEVVAACLRDVEEVSLSWQFLAPAFTGMSLEPNARFGDLQYTFAQAVSCGALQNAIQSNVALAAQVPRPSLFVLFGHAKTLVPELPSLAPPSATCIRRIVTLVASPIDGFRFEELHAHWHALVVPLHCERRDVSMLRLVDDGKHYDVRRSAVYRNPLVFKGEVVDLDRNVAMPSVPVRIVAQKISVASIVDWTDQLQASVAVPKLEYNQIVLPGKPNNEGFDALVLHKTAAGEPHLVIIECKCSKSDATTELSWKEKKVGIQKKVESVRAYLNVVLKNPLHPIHRSDIRRLNQVTMLVIANREPIDKFHTDAMAWVNDLKNEVHFNFAVITRKALFDLYGDVLRNAVAFTI